MRQLFIPLTKIDAVQRLVYGRIDETPDRAGEVFDYLGSKPEFEKWSKTQQEASGGKSFGNVRAMHGPVAAGRLDAITFDDQGKAINLVAKITDDAEWQKIEDGVYTGFSPGGRYLKRWPDGANTRYTAQPYEVSLVDLPCIPSATFTMVKAAGIEEQRPFKAPAELGADLVARLTKGLDAAANRSEIRALLLVQPISVLKAVFPEESSLAFRHQSGAEREEALKQGWTMPDGAFPIEHQADLEDAVKAFGLADDPDAVRAHIVKRAKEIGATDVLPADWEGSTKPAEKSVPAGTLAKGMESIACLARILQDIRWLQQSQEFESALEGDGSDLPAKIKAWLAAGAELLVQTVGEEVAELRDGESADMALAAKPAGLVKFADFTKLAMERAGAMEDLAKVSSERDALRKRVAELEAMPAPGGPRLKVIEKGADVSSAADSDALDDELKKIDAMPDGQAKSLAMIKLAVKHPAGVTV